VEEQDASYSRGLRQSLHDRAGLLQVLPDTSPLLTIGVLVTTAIAGALPPAFNVASGALAGAVQARRPVTTVLVVATLLYFATHLIGPIREAMGSALMRRVDAALTVRVMRAVVVPRGIAHLEDADVLDRISQSQGAVTAITPGAGAYYLVQVWAQRLQGSLSLLLVASYSIPLAALLLAGHVVSFRWRRWHWREVTAVVMDRTEGMRRAHYLRRLAVEPLAAKEARVFSLAPWLRDRYREAFLDVMDQVWSKRRNGGLTAVAVTVGMLAAEGGAIALVARAAAVGDIGLAKAVVVAQSIVAASNLGSFSEANLFVADGAAALRVLLGLERAVPAAVSSMDGTRPADGMPRHAIRFEDVGFRYPGRSDDVYRGLDLEIEAGRSLAIVGENGAGKTTLVKLLARLHDPTAGRITVDGVDLRDLDPSAWQRRIAAIFQDFVQYKFSAADNVAFGDVDGDRSADRLRRAAELAGAIGVVDGLPHGWDTILSRQFTDGADLSGGEWQRLALARAVYAVDGGAGILILDEPTAALDVRGEAEVYDRFLELTRGLTTIVISHRFSTVRRADRIVVVEHGRVVEDGDHHSLVAAGGRYATMYELQAARFRDEAPSP
jgi:ATP-binding cassette subfamily B protein